MPLVACPVLSSMTMLRTSTGSGSGSGAGSGLGSGPGLDSDSDPGLESGAEGGEAGETPSELPFPVLSALSGGSAGSDGVEAPGVIAGEPISAGGGEGGDDHAGFWHAASPAGISISNMMAKAGRAIFFITFSRNVRLVIC